MATVDDLDQVIEQFDLAQGEVVRGNPEPALKLFSHQEYVTLNNPLPSRARMGGGRYRYGSCRIAVQGWRDRRLRDHREAGNS